MIHNIRLVQRIELKVDRSKVKKILIHVQVSDKNCALFHYFSISKRLTELGPLMVYVFATSMFCKFVKKQ